MTRKIGDTVRPKIGPHAGIEHKITHIHDDGSYNIKPVNINRGVKYKQGSGRISDKNLHEESLDEISNRTLNSYVNKAVGEFGDNKLKLGKTPAKYDKNDEKKSLNRRLGISRAARKMASGSIWDHDRKPKKEKVNEISLDGVSARGIPKPENETRREKKIRFARIIAKNMMEDAPTNNVGGGHIASVGVGPQGEPGVKKAVIARIRRRNAIEFRKYKNKK